MTNVIKIPNILLKVFCNLNCKSRSLLLGVNGSSHSTCLREVRIKSFVVIIVVVVTKAAHYVN